MSTSSVAFIWRQSVTEATVALVWRHDQSKWTLPEGMRREHERWHDAALRTASETVGKKLEPLGFVDATSTKLYFDFLLDEPVDVQFETPVGKIWFVSPREALNTLTDENDKNVLRSHVAPGPLKPRATTPTQTLWLFLKGLNVSYAQLQQALAVQWREQRVVEQEAFSNDALMQWALRARHELRSAETVALEDPELGWVLFKRAKRTQLCAMTEARRAAEWAGIYEEAKDKLGKWRLATVKDLIGAKPTIEAMAKVAEMLDGHHDAFFARARMIQQRLALTVVLLMGAVSVFELSVAHQLSEGKDYLVLYGLNLLRIAPVLGVIGAICSGLLSSVGANVERRPQVILDSAIVFARVALGAGSGLGAVFVFGEAFKTPLLIAAAAFAAGFSERVLPAQIDRLFGDAKKAPKPEDAPVS